MRDSVNFAAQSLKHKVHPMLERAHRKIVRGFPGMRNQEKVKGDDSIREDV